MEVHAHVYINDVFLSLYMCLCYVLAKVCVTSLKRCLLASIARAPEMLCNACWMCGCDDAVEQV